MFDLVVHGGNVVTPEAVRQLDVGVEGGKIAALSPELTSGHKEINATGLTIFPGLIDVHVHFNEPGRADWEGAHTGSRALARGGGTLYFDMPLNSTPCTLDSSEFEKKRNAFAAAS